MRTVNSTTLAQMALETLGAIKSVNVSDKKKMSMLFEVLERECAGGAYQVFSGYSIFAGSYVHLHGDDLKVVIKLHQRMGVVAGYVETKSGWCKLILKTRDLKEALNRLVESDLD